MPICRAQNCPTPTCEMLICPALSSPMPTSPVLIFRVRIYPRLNSVTPIYQAPIFLVPICRKPYYRMPTCLMQSCRMPTCRMLTSPGPAYPVPISAAQPGPMEENAGLTLLGNARRLLPGRISGQWVAAAREAALGWGWAADRIFAHCSRPTCFFLEVCEQSSLEKGKGYKWHP